MFGLPNFDCPRKQKKYKKIQIQLSFLFSAIENFVTCIYFVASIQQTTNFFPKFFPVVEKDNKLFIGPTLIFSLSWTTEKFVFFFNCSTEKISWKKLETWRFVVWGFDVTNWLSQKEENQKLTNWITISMTNFKTDELGP